MTETVSTTCGGGTASGRRSSTGYWPSRVASAPSAADPTRNMWTTITSSVTYVASCASTATEGLGSSGTASSNWAGDQLPERNHVSAGLDPSGRLPAVFTTPGLSSFSDFLTAAAPQL